MVDLKAQYDSIKEEVDEAVRGVIERGEFILGSEVEAFEEEMAASNARGYDRIHNKREPEIVGRGGNCDGLYAYYR